MHLMPIVGWYPTPGRRGRGRAAWRHKPVMHPSPDLMPFLARSRNNVRRYSASVKPIRWPVNEADPIPQFEVFVVGHQDCDAERFNVVHREDVPSVGPVSVEQQEEARVTGSVPVRSRVQRLIMVIGHCKIAHRDAPTAITGIRAGTESDNGGYPPGGQLSSLIRGGAYALILIKVRDRITGQA